MKTVRFTQVVEAAGRPEPYTLWMEPKDDPVFQRALKAHRVLSVHQETVGTKADYGEVGFNGVKGELLIFPKSLRRFAGRRVVGVKYDLLQPPEKETPKRR